MSKVLPFSRLDSGKARTLLSLFSEPDAGSATVLCDELNPSLFESLLHLTWSQTSGVSVLGLWPGSERPRRRRAGSFEISRFAGCIPK